MTQVKAFKFILLALLLTVLVGISIMMTQVTVYTTVNLEEYQIIVENENYYLLVDHRKLKLNEDQLKFLELENFPTYKLTYRYNKLMESKGKVLRLEVYGKEIR